MAEELLGDSVQSPFPEQLRGQRRTPGVKLNLHQNSSVTSTSMQEVMKIG
jgi:hypothetical protein